MHCDACGSYNIVVIDSRPTNHNFVRRRRSCKKCNFRWSTVEIPNSNLIEEMPVDTPVILVPKRGDM